MLDANVTGDKRPWAGSIPCATTERTQLNIFCKDLCVSSAPLVGIPYTYWLQTAEGFTRPHWPNKKSKGNFSICLSCVLQMHSRRIRTEEKVVTDVWGDEIIINTMPQIIFSTRIILKKRVNRIKATLVWMDALKKWMFIRFTPYQTTALPKWMFSQTFCSNHPCC